MTRGEILLFGAAGLLATVAALRASMPPLDEAVIDRERIAPPRHAAPPVPVSPPAAHLVRPLFSRPPSGLSLESSNEEPPTSGLGSNPPVPRLVGVIIRNGNRIAIIDYRGRIERVGESGKVGAWTLTRIEHRSVMVESGIESRLIKLDPGASEKANE